MKSHEQTGLSEDVDVPQSRRNGQGKLAVIIMAVGGSVGSAMVLNGCDFEPWDAQPIVVGDASRGMDARRPPDAAITQDMADVPDLAKPPTDLTELIDLSIIRDMATPDAALDLAKMTDSAVVADDDLAIEKDLAIEVDLAVERDLAVAMDLATESDLAIEGDLASEVDLADTDGEAPLPDSSVDGDIVDFSVDSDGGDAGNPFIDVDKDGVAACTPQEMTKWKNGMAVKCDCDDSNPLVSPKLPELCDAPCNVSCDPNVDFTLQCQTAWKGLDNNCNGVDDVRELSQRGYSQDCAPGKQLICDKRDDKPGDPTTMENIACCNVLNQNVCL